MQAFFISLKHILVIINAIRASGTRFTARSCGMHSIATGSGPQQQSLVWDLSLSLVFSALRMVYLYEQNYTMKENTQMTTRALVNPAFALTILVALAASSSGVALEAATPPANKPAQPQGREATPAVVNPALRSLLRQTISLDGTWDFAIDPDKKGDAEKWFSPKVALPNKIDIQVPGCWEAQGVGGPGTSVSVTPEQANRPLIGSYVGTAWYKKTVTIPAQWQGKEIWLKFGGVHCQGWFWANGTYLNHDKSYCGAYKYRVTDLVDSNGELVIAAKVRNDLPSGKGLFGWIQRFGGLYRSVELDATPSVLVDYAFVEGDLDKKTAAVNVKVRSTKSGNVSVKVQVKISKLDGTVAAKVTKTVSVDGNSTKDVVLNTSLNPFYSWSPENPNLYRADISLKVNGREIDGWVERFGVRKWEVRGSNFYLNNRKHLVRGFGDDYIYPLTIVSPADKSIHVQHLSLAKQCGFNYVRHHTHCELPEFFDAADEVGIMVQPELPYYGSRPSAGDASWFRPEEDLREMVTHYRRYVSLSTYCTGNEGHLGSPIDKEIYALAKKLDPSRLFLHQDGGTNYCYSGSQRNDFGYRESNVTVANSDFGTGSRYISPPSGGAAAWPWFAHEYLCVEIDSDPRLAWKYTGAQLPPVPADFYDPELEAAGLDVGWRDAILDSGLYQQRLWQKFGIESSRLDPDCDGYHYWVIVDVGLFGELGVFDPFWGVKKTTPEYFYKFNSPTTILAAYGQRPIGADQRILAQGESLNVDWWISHFEETPLNNATLTWRLETDSGVLGSGTVTDINAAVGDIKQVGTTSFTIPSIQTAVKANLIAVIDGTSVENSWELWLFPQFVPQAGSGDGLAASANVYNLIVPRYPGLALLGTPDAENAQVIITDRIDGPIMEALQAGKSVLALNLTGPEPGLHQEWPNARQKGTAVADHPAFGDFPHDGYLNYLFFRLLKCTVALNDPTYSGVDKLMVNRGVWPLGYCGHVFQGNADQGKILGTGLNLLNNNVEAVYLLDQFINYVRSPYFDPKGNLPAMQLEKMIEAAKKMEKLNGWSKTVKQHYHTGSYDSFAGPLPLDIARFSHGQSEVEWLTKTVPHNTDINKPYTFEWVAALGWIAEPEAQFDLYLGEEKLLSFGVALKDAVWKSDDGRVSLKYKSIQENGVDSSGIMTLKVPGKMIKPAQKSLLRVVAPQTGSQRWFGLYRYR